MPEETTGTAPESASAEVIAGAAQWKRSAYGIKYFRCEGFDYDIWQKNARLMRQTITFPRDVLGRPAEECIYLAGIYGPPDPPMAQAYAAWRAEKLYSMAFWAFDQYCLNSREIQMTSAAARASSAATYRKPCAARAAPVHIAAPVAVAPTDAFNRFAANRTRLNE
jgi:hypothetical protein